MNELIIESCCLGDPQAIETLVRQYQGVVYRVCLSILNDPSDAEDAAQETFIAALKALKGFRGQSAFSTWLYAIALNICRRQLKRRRRHHALHAALKLAQPAFGDTAADPEQTVIRAEAARGIERAVFDLDENHRLPVILRYYHELSISEIAEIMNIREGTVHSRLFNARERMRDQMKARNPYTEKKGTRQ